MPSASVAAATGRQLLDSTQDLTVRDYLRPVLRLKWAIAAVVLFVAAITYGHAHHEPKVYVSATRVLLTGAGAGNSADSQLLLSDRGVADQIALLSTTAVAKKVARRLGHPAYAGVYAASITATGVTGADFIIIRSSYSNPRTAAKIANAFAQAFIDLRGQRSRQSLQSAIDATQRELDQIKQSPSNSSQRQTLLETIRRLRVDLATSSAQAQQVNEAGVSATPVSPRPVRDTAVATAVALIAAIALAYAIAAFDGRLRRPEDVSAAFGLPVLAVVPDTDDRAVFHDGRAAVGDALREPLRHLRSNIRLAGDRPARLILVTSAVPKEGKSTVVRNLAIALHEAGASVAVVDADLRRPTLAKLYRHDGEPGVTNVLVGDVSLEDALVTIPVDARGLETVARLAAEPDAPETPESDQAVLHLLPSGAVPADPETVLASEAFHDVLDRLLAEHDTVLLDTAPILNVADTISLTHKADAMILVARVGVVTRRDARRLEETLERLSETPQIGVVVTGTAPNDGYRYGYGDRS